MSGLYDLPPGADLSKLPRDADGPVFKAPWEAQAFAIVVGLCRRGSFGWTEWTQTLAAEIKRAQAHGDRDHGDTYYHHWLAALETLLAAKRLTDADECRAREFALKTAAEAAHVTEGRFEPVWVG